MQHSSRLLPALLDALEALQDHPLIPMSWPLDSSPDAKTSNEDTREYLKLEALASEDHYKELLARTVDICGEYAAAPQSSSSFSSHMPLATKTLCGLVSYGHAAEVRKSAVLALQSICKSVPYSEIHPHRRALERTLLDARDDPRRAVRLAAVMAVSTLRSVGK